MISQGTGNKGTPPVHQTPQRPPGAAHTVAVATAETVPLAPTFL